MANNSIARFTLVLPVPITAFNQMLAHAIKSIAIETTLTTGIAAVIKSLPCLYICKKRAGVIFNNKNIKHANPRLSFIIFKINSFNEKY